MNKKYIFILAIVLVALITLTAWIAISLGQENPNSPSRYSAVYLSSGDIYFGELSLFPKAKIKNPWLIQQTTNAQNQPELSIVPLSGAFWGPSKTVYLNTEQIVFWTRLRKDSQIAQYLSNPSEFSGNRSTNFGGNSLSGLNASN